MGLQSCKQYAKMSIFTSTSLSQRGEAGLHNVLSLLNNCPDFLQGMVKEQQGALGISLLQHVRTCT